MKKITKNDLILIISLLVAILAGLLAVLLTKQKKNLFAKIYVANELRETIDLDKAEDQIFLVEGTKGTVKVQIKEHSIGIIESNCPHQDCVSTGFIKESNSPIICAYNEVYIIIEGDSSYDVRLE